MENHSRPAALLAALLSAAIITLIGSQTTHAKNVSDVQNDEVDVTLFRGAANNSYFPVYFRALPEEGADKVEMESHAIDLRPERDVTLHVEIYNPNSVIPLIITPGGNGDTEGFGGFARNVAAAAPELKVIIYDRRNLGQSEVTFGNKPHLALSSFTTDFYAVFITNGELRRSKAFRYTASSYWLLVCQQRKRMRIHLNASARKAD